VSFPAEFLRKAWNHVARIVGMCHFFSALGGMSLVKPASRASEFLSRADARVEYIVAESFGNSAF
jgi:hypothetical protein